MTLPPVQAGSLAKVIELANDPPTKLQWGSEAGVQEPLVLYIARVPGSRDVFLTTMKPQQKVVTAQDIQNSLYYVHVDSEKDVDLLKSEGEDDMAFSEDDEEPFTMPVGKNAVHRKPLLPPRQPVHELGIRLDVHSQFQSMNPTLPPRPMPGRKSVGQDSDKSGFSNTEAGSMSAHRKVFGPRPLHDRFHSVNNTALGDVPERQNIDTRRWSEQSHVLRPPLPQRPDEQKARRLDEMNRPISVQSNENTSFLKSSRSSCTSESYDSLAGQRSSSKSSLTLIRRYDYLQSNVGKIMASSLPSYPLKLDLIGSGYSKFIANENGHLEATSLEEQEQAVYTCLLDNIVSSRRPTGDVRTESHDSPLAHRSGLRASLDLRKRSHLSSNGLDEPQNHKTGSKGYTFQSPWNGTCDFVTGVAGRSLKCRHTHPSRYGKAVDVSELRFNLPSSKTFASAPKSSIAGTPRESKRASYFLNGHRRQDSFESIDTSGNGSQIDLEDRLDLSLGQEHAGGGFGGRQAKLGKLIVEPEGLQMLDLVVAANMALWWRVYDRMV